MLLAPGFFLCGFLKHFNVRVIQKPEILGVWPEFWETLIYWATCTSFKNLSFAGKNVRVLVKTWVFIGPEFWFKRTKKACLLVYHKFLTTLCKCRGGKRSLLYWTLLRRRKASSSSWKAGNEEAKPGLRLRRIGWQASQGKFTQWWQL